MVQVFLSRKVASKEERLSPLESGFERIISLMSVRAPFFFLAVLFVLFDLELILFFPGVVSISEEVVIIFVWISINFIITFTLVLEWSFCGLKWQI